MKKLLVLSIMFTFALALTGCDLNKNDETKDDKTSDVETCKDCVYSYYSYYTEGGKNYGENGSTLTKYAKDYKELKDENGDQRTYFIGHILDENNKILKGFACGIYNNKLFCLEPGKDKVESNKNILKNLFDSDKCYEFESDDGIKVFACGMPRKEMVASVSENGGVIVGDIKGSCNLNNGTIECYESQM